MPLFHYKAVTPDGVTVSGEMEAPSQLAVVERLQAQGHFPLTADEHKKEARAARRLFGPKKPSQARLALMTGEVATLLEAGLPLDRALELARDVAETPDVRTVLERLLTRIRGGSSFAQALGEEGDFFPKIYVSTIQAGEAGAALGPVMRRLGTYLEKAAALRETVKSALVYPIILAVVVLASIIILLTVVVPQFKPMFEEAGRALPLPTQIVVAAGDAVANYGWLMGLVVLGTIALVRRAMKRPALQRLRDRILLRLWLIGSLVARIETARFSRTLATLLENGVLPLGALGIASETIRNSEMRGSLSSVLSHVRSGKGLGDALQETGRFPHLAVQLVRVGEETGRPSEMLMKVADIYEGEVQRYIDRLMALLVPALTVGLGVIVAGIIASLLLAVLSVNDLAF